MLGKIALCHVQHVDASYLLLRTNAAEQSQDMILQHRYPSHSDEQGEAIHRDLSKAHGQWSDEFFH